MTRRAALVAIGAVAILVGSATIAPGATVTSTFDASLEGWGVSGDPNGAPTHVATGGNPGGFMRVTDRGSGISMYWEAPARFRRAVAYGGTLRFDLRQSGSSGQYDDDDVVVIGGGFQVVYNLPTNPGTAWTRYVVPLREDARWTNKSTNKRATAAEMRKAFASPANLRMRAEFISGADTDDLDNVVLTSTGSGEPPPPVAGKSVVADVVSGVVFVQVPSGKSIKRGKGKSSRAYAAKFRRFKGKANIPTGSKIDTRKGRIAITSAADLKGGTGTGEFYDGLFQIKQARAAKPVTDALLITSRSGCGEGSARASAKRKLGRLWATAKGKFRTRGRYSAASVRGTTWLTEDRCDGTFTKVSRGRVAVRDNVKRKTVLLTAGQSYFARAQRASSR